jgi:hypothetical protein
MTIDKPGLYDMPAEEYHADPAPVPSLSASIAARLLDETPLHASLAHPRLTAEPIEMESKAMDLGTAAHALVLEGRDVVIYVDAPDWRTAAAKTARDDARAAGKAPLLLKDKGQLEAMHATLLDHLNEHGEGIFILPGKAEQALVWEEDGTWFRSRLDWLRASLDFIADYKTTATTADPDGWQRRLFDGGYDIQCAMNIRGLKAVRAAMGLPDVPVEFRFVVQEVTMPYAASVLALTPAAMAYANDRLDQAIEIWRECMATGKWPAYPTLTCYVDAPGWAQARHEDRKSRREFTKRLRPSTDSYDPKLIENGYAI